MKKNNYTLGVVRFVRVVFLAAMFIGLAGCATTELVMYCSPVPAEGQDSIVLIPSGIRIHSINGKKSGFMLVKRNTFYTSNRGEDIRTLRLSPGKHEIHFQLRHSIYVRTGTLSKHSHEIKFTTEPGKTYRLTHMVIEPPESGADALRLAAWIDEKLPGGNWMPLTGTTQIAPIEVIDKYWQYEELTQIFNNYDPANLPDYGLLVFSSTIENTTPPFPVQLTFARIRETNKTFVPADVLTSSIKASINRKLPAVVINDPRARNDLMTGNPVESLSPGDPVPREQIIGQVHAVALPAGKYCTMSFYRNLSKRRRTASRTYTYQELFYHPYVVAFDIEPGKVTYLGNIVTEVGVTESSSGFTVTGRYGRESVSVSLEVRDEKERDLALFGSTYPMLKDAPVLRPRSTKRSVPGLIDKE